MPKNKLPVPPPNWNISCQYTTRKANRNPRSQTTKLAKPREDTRKKLDAESKQKFFRKPSSSIPEPTNDAKSVDGARETMETEPKSELLAARTNGRQQKPLGRVYGKKNANHGYPVPTEILIRAGLEKLMNQGGMWWT